MLKCCIFSQTLELSKQETAQKKHCVYFYSMFYKFRYLYYSMGHVNKHGKLKDCN